jgi:hypothetical protein
MNLLEAVLIEKLSSFSLNEQRLTVHDKGSWHPDHSHIQQTLSWLNSHGCLSPEGKEIAKVNSGKDISIHDRMLNDKGKKVMKYCYPILLKSAKWGELNVNKLFDKCYKVHKDMKKF